MTRWSLLLFLFVALPAAAQAQPVAQPALPTVRVVATGGTIAGVQDAPGTLGGYRAGTKSVSEIVQSVPELVRFADIEAEQFLECRQPRDHAGALARAVEADRTNCWRGRTWRAWSSPTAPTGSRRPPSFST